MLYIHSPHRHHRHHNVHNLPLALQNGQHWILGTKSKSLGQIGLERCKKDKEVRTSLEIHHTGFPSCKLFASRTQFTLHICHWFRTWEWYWILEVDASLSHFSLRRNSLLMCIQPSRIQCWSINCHFWTDWILYCLFMYRVVKTRRIKPNAEIHSHYFHPLDPHIQLLDWNNRGECWQSWPSRWSHCRNHNGLCHRRKWR